MACNTSPLQEQQCPDLSENPSTESEVRVGPQERVTNEGSLARQLSQ